MELARSTGRIMWGEDPSNPLEEGHILIDSHTNSYLPQSDLRCSWLETGTARCCTLRGHADGPHDFSEPYQVEIEKERCAKIADDFIAPGQTVAASIADRIRGLNRNDSDVKYVTVPLDLWR